MQQSKAENGDAPKTPQCQLDATQMMMLMIMVNLMQGSAMQREMHQQTIFGWNSNADADGIADNDADC